MIGGLYCESLTGLNLPVLAVSFGGTDCVLFPVLQCWQVILSHPTLNIQDVVPDFGSELLVVSQSRSMLLSVLWDYTSG